MIGSAYSESNQRWRVRYMTFFVRVRKALVLEQWLNKPWLNALFRKIGLVKCNETPPFHAIIQIMRPQHWIKNGLVAVPLIVGYHFHSVEALRKSILGFIVFCLLAASVYIINDWVDREHDTQHPYKKNRPFASGQLSPQTVYWLIPFLFFSALLLMYYLPITFFIVAMSYYLMTFFYSFFLKRRKWLDIIVLVLLYLLRILAGMTLVENGYSAWLLFLGFFLFMSLALVKRYAELCRVKTAGQLTLLGRAYRWQDSQTVFILGHVSAYAAVFVLFFYIFSQKVALFYLHPFILIPIGPLLLVWISRLWYLAAQGKIQDDPVSFTAKDRFSWLLVLIIGLIATLARLY
jgi:4-hydroxybenzoate polyprenyltransferase